MHEVLGKGFAPFYDGGVRAGTETGHARFFQRVHGAQHQRIVGCDDGIVDALLLRKRCDARDVLCAHGHAFCLCGDAAVAGQDEDLVRLGAAPERSHYGVLSAARTHYEQFHVHLNDGKDASR